MAGWAGWRTGPAGAGAAGPTRLFLAVTLAGMVIVAAVLFWDRRWPAGMVATLAAGYFALRLFAGLGRRKDP